MLGWWGYPSWGCLAGSSYRWTMCPWLTSFRTWLSLPAPEGLLERPGVSRGARASWADAVDGRGRLVLIAGEAGIGKTALVREFCERRAAAAAAVVGACDGLCTARPLARLRDIATNASDGFAETIARGERPARCFAA